MFFNHWAYRIAKQINDEVKGDIVITSGITTSGYPHLGTLVEGLIPSTIAKVLREEMQRDVKFYFIADIMDAFDNIPKELEVYKDFLQPHLGKPLVNVPDPFNYHNSYGEHFLEETIKIFHIFNINPTIKKADELYKQGCFDEQTFILLRNFEKVKKIVEETSNRKLEKEWHLIMPICQNCGKIATTTVIYFNEEGDYEYLCNKDVGYTKGCGYKGKGNIKERNYKLQWRLHWPSWQYYFNTSAEGGGLDHFTKGGSWDTAKEIHRQIFNRKEPIAYRWGFILEHGRKMSKSKGVILSLNELINLFPWKVIAYHILKFDLEENINLNPEKEALLNIIDDYESAAEMIHKEERTRAEEKKAAAYYLVENGKTWQLSFRDFLLYYAIYRDWQKVEFHLKAKPGDIKKYIEYWFDKDFVPEEYKFSYKPTKANEKIREFFESLNDNMDPLAIHNFVYSFAKEKGLDTKWLFAEIYKVLIGKNKGPRLGKLIYALGVKKVKADVL